ncbi:hypothetical protein XI04_03770 [Bradyrhizobium sp. CCBAU 11430]|nr:hypothetical protein [Bradyrhizobium sp. CCBAU 25360]MDA9512188.1 hypothetical protein [Bradyrhizobium sp. CCBAU 11430]
MEIEPRTDRTAFFIVRRMAQVGIDKAESSGISAVRRPRAAITPLHMGKLGIGHKEPQCQ